MLRIVYFWLSVLLLAVLEPVSAAEPHFADSPLRAVRTQRSIVHLFNDIDTSGGHAFPNDDVPLRVETLPIHDIRVTFRSGTKIASVRVQPEGKLLEMKAT